MANVLVNESTLQGIASAIREKNGLSETYKPAQMISAIQEIPSGGGDADEAAAVIISKSISGVYSNSAVTKVGANIFEKCSTLTGVNFPNCTVIGASAFNSCSSLVTVSLPQVTNIGQCAFYSCSNITTISLPNCTTIGESAFLKCTKLSSIDIPKVGNFGAYAFFGCASLATIDASVASYINSGVFSECENLTSVNIPNVSYIGASAFMKCFNLSYISVPKLTDMGSCVFASCSALTSMVFPKLSKLTGQNTFSGCRNLESIYLYYSSVVQLGNVNVFWNTTFSKSTLLTPSRFGSIYVPSSLYNSYIVATNWTTFSARIVSMA